MSGLIHINSIIKAYLELTMSLIFLSESGSPWPASLPAFSPSRVLFTLVQLHAYSPSLALPEGVPVPVWLGVRLI